jgi:hypothetical protein
MVEIRGHQVFDRRLGHFRPRVSRPVEDERDARQRFAQAQRRERGDELPSLFFLAALGGAELPEFDLINVAPTG